MFHLRDEETDLSHRRVLAYSMASGGISAGITLLLTYPLYFCQTVISSHVGSVKEAKFSTFRQCCKTSVKNHGVVYLYKGFGPAVISVSVNRSVYFGAYDFVKAAYHYESAIERFIVAQAIAAVASFLSYPIETIGRRMIFDKKDRIIGMTNCALWIYKRDGIRGFFMGALVNMMRSTSGALLLVLHDDISRFAWKNLK